MLTTCDSDFKTLMFYAYILFFKSNRVTKDYNKFFQYFPYYVLNCTVRNDRIESDRGIVFDNATHKCPIIKCT